MKTYRGVDVEIHIFLTSALARGKWSASGPCRFIPGTHWIGGWVDPRVGLDDLEKRKFLTVPGLELRHVSHPGRSQSPYRVRYPGSLKRVLLNFTEFLLCDYVVIQYCVIHSKVSHCFRPSRCRIYLIKFLHNHCLFAVSVERPTLTELHNLSHPYYIFNIPLT
jgi:hypothetical protein